MVQQTRPAPTDLLPDQLSPDVWVFVCDDGRDNEVDALIQRFRSQQFRYLGSLLHLLTDYQVQQSQQFLFSVHDDFVIFDLLVLLEVADRSIEDCRIDSIRVKLGINIGLLFASVLRHHR